ncbi:MAG: PAS domain S-box protein [Nitrospirae bacterium]|jgi:PAS domain S-box-containing protein|nr:PAS domain S-box protein [Nitrospirota bacterium]
MNKISKNTRLSNNKNSKNTESKNKIKSRTKKPTHSNNKYSDSYKFYRDIFNKMAVPTIIIDEDMTIRLMNHEAEKLSGYSKKEVENKKKWTEFVPEHEIDRMKEYHRLRSIEPDIAPRSYESQFYDKNGKIKDILIMIDLLSDGKKRVASVLDITERKQSIEALRKSEELLRKKVKNFETVFDMNV